MKKFIEKKVMDYKFRGAGQGHRLDEEKPKPRPSSAPSSNKRAAPSTSSQAAGQAALARLEGGGDKRHSAAATATKAATKQPQPHQSSEKVCNERQSKIPFSKSYVLCRQLLVLVVHNCSMQLLEVL